LNYDPLTADVTIGGDIPIVGKMKFIQGVISGTPETLDIANLNDLEKAEYFSDVLQENAVKLSSKDKEKVAIRNSTTFKTGNMIPGLAKMGLEIAATTYFTGGTGTHLAIAKNSARLIEAMLPGRALTPYIGRWLSGTINESIGLLGSNTIGGITTNSEPMPVLSFAAGASFGRTLYGGLTRNAQNNFNRYKNSLLSKYKQGTATYSQETMLKAIGIVERGPTRTISTVGQGLLKPAISVGAIKLGEVSSGLVEQGLGAAGVVKPQLSFDEFWHHITDPHSFLELYGAMITMGAAHPGALKGGVHKSLDAVKTDIEIMSKGKYAQEMWNDMGRPFGLRRLSAIKQDGDISSEKYQWTDKEIDDVVKKKIDQINKTSDEKWDPFIQGRTKKEAIDIVTKQGERLKLKRVVQEQWVDRFKSLDLAQGEGSLYLRFENAIKGIEKGEINKAIREEHDAIAEAVSIVGESKVGEMLEAAGIDKYSASKVVESAMFRTRYMDAARFHAKDPITGKTNPLRTRAVTQIDRIEVLKQFKKQLKEGKENGEIDPETFKRENKSVDVELEAEVAKLDETIKEQNKLNEKQYQLQKEVIEKTQPDVDIVDADFKADPERLIRDIAEKTDSEEDVLGFLETIREPSGKLKTENVEDLMRQMFGIGGFDFKENIAGFEVFIPQNIKGEKVNKLIQVFDKQKLFAARNKATNELETYSTTSGVLIHEPLHSILGSRISELGTRRRAEEIRKENPKLSLEKALKEAKNERDSFVEDFISVLKETKEYDIVFERVKNHPDYRADKLTEEWFTIYGELVNEGKVGWDSGTKKFSKLVDSFNEIIDAKDFFKTARDVRTFIQGFAKGRGIEANEIIQKATKDYIELNKKYGTEVVEKMSKDVGPELELLYKENKADWDSERQDKGANKFITELIMNGQLDGLIKAKIPWDRPPGFSEEDFMVSVYQELIPHIRNFNKNFREGKTDVENDSIFAWINTYLSRKIGNVFKKGLAGTKDEFEISIDQEREGSAKFDIKAEVDGDREVAQARITSQKTLKDAGLESVSQEISSNLNDLNFKRLPKITTETSKNQTISPFLREFKKESGEKVQKVIMEAMGKKQKYIDYLSNNFGGVIENLPTGYLLKNFPFLMQKSVGGKRIEVEGGFKEFKPKWTSNWQGKKIDYVGSERGMTSRPEYVRLNPEWKSELNKERFVETMTDFPGSKNISRDIAAKKKALAYQLGSEIALKKFEEQGKEYFKVQSEINKKQEDIESLRLDMAKLPDTRASERLIFGDKIAKLRDQIVDLEVSRMDLDMFNAYTKSTGYEPKGFEQKLNQQIIESTYRKSSTITKLFNAEQKVEFMLNLRNLSGEIQRLASKNNGKVEKQVVKDALRTVYGNFEWSDKGRVKKGGAWSEYYSFLKEKDWDSIAQDITTSLSEIKNSPRFNESKFTDLITIDEVITRLEREGQKLSKEQLNVKKKIVELFRDPEVRKKVIQTTEGVYKSVVEAVEVYSKDGKLLTKETEIAKAKKLINLALFNSQFTSTGSPERGGIFGGRVENFMKEIILPAAEYNNLIIERTSKPKSIKVYKANSNGSKGELLAAENRLNNFSPKSATFMKEKYIKKDGSFDFENKDFLEDLELINKDADTAWDLLNELYTHSSNMYKDGKIDNNTLFVFTKATQNTMNGLVRAAAKLEGIYLPLEGESYIVKNQGSELEWEHQKAAETVTNELTKIYLNENFRDKSNSSELNKQGLKALQELKDGFVVNIIPDSMNKFLNKVGLQVFRTKEGYYVENTLGDPSMRAIYNLKSGKVEGQEWAKAAEIATGSKDVRLNNSKALESTGVIPSSIKMSSNKKMIETARTVDKAIEKSREKEAPVKKIRVFDFDDTLAQTKSRVYYNKANTSGKPATKFKAVMLAGSPGSGKSSIVKGLGLEKQGYKIVNQDISLEWAKKLVGLPEAEGEYDAVQRSKRSELGALARKIAERKLDKFTEIGTGVIIDGTGASLKATKARVEALKSKGYDVKMLFVSSSKETSISRNQARKERSLKDFIVEKSWDSVNKNKAEYIRQFGQDFFEVNTDNLKQGEVPADFKEMVNTNLNAIEKGRLNAGEFASKGKELVDQGFVMDFSDFNIVKEGQRGPLFNVAEKIRDARGTDDVFVLTARSQESAEAIQAFLKSEGLDLPIENIKGLGDSTGEAKAQWLVEKAAEGYNDFYFADDHLANVEAVRDALEQLPVKSKVQQAKPKIKFSFDTKRDLKWEPMGPASERDGQKVQVVESTQWDIKGKKYGMYIERLFGEMLEMEISYLADKNLIGEKQGVDIQKLQEYIFNEMEYEDINYNVGMDMGFFKIEKSKHPGREFDQISEITETGDSQAIFSVVINGLKEKIREDKKSGINYQLISYAAKVEGGRPSLYRLFAREFGRQLGFKVIEEPMYKSEYTAGGVEVVEKTPWAYKFNLIKESLFEDADAVIEPVKTKFSLNTKQELDWKKHANKIAYPNTSEAEFTINNKDYLMDVETKDVGSIFQRLEDPEYVTQLKEAGYDIEAIENRLRDMELGKGPKSKMFDAGFYKLGEESWTAPDGRMVRTKDVDITGSGDAAEVLSVVVNGLVDKYKSTKGVVGFQFTSFEDNRTSLYRRIANLFAEELNLEVFQGEPTEAYGTDFFLVDKNLLGETKKLKELDTELEVKSADPVQRALNVVDRNRPQQVENRVKFSSENMSRKFNMILEESTGVEHYKVFSEAKGRVVGASAKRQRFFIPPSAEDFQGLLYPTLGKGAVGEKHQKFYEEALFKPYNRGVSDLASDRAALMTDFKALKKTLKVPKDLRKKTESGFTNEQAVRVWLWNKTEQEVPGISKGDLSQLLQIVESDNTLKLFAEEILALTKNDGYSTPKQHWLTGTITTDLIDLLNTTKRAKYLKQWQENSDAMFTKENLNKLEAIYGPKYREALENSLRAMKTGRNRGGTVSRLSNAALDYINGSVGVIMFTNMRSALLQGISTINFINWDFNNPLKAGGAFLNLPQFAKDFKYVMNSKYLTDRRNGLKLNIHENEIANAAKTSKNKAAAIINLIIEKGYSPTKFMDSFAIAFGGATYYRNRAKDLMKKNPKLSIEEAQKRAFEEMRDVSEKTQQSSDPSKISQQQRSDLGRLVLQFVNTPMQYARLQKRAVQDLVNRRGDPKEHISKLIYYGFVQNLIFNGLQQALFAFGFEDDEKKVEAALPKKTMDIANGMLDSSLRGLGLAGVTVGVLKNLVLDVYDRSKKDRPEYQDAWMKLLQFSPAISSKVRRLKNAGWAFDSKDRRKMIKEEGFSIDNPAVEAGANVVSAATNLPTDRILKKVNNLRAIAKDETELWMDIALFLGWPEWQLTVPDAPEQVKAKKKAEKEAKKKAKNKPKPVYRKKGGYKPVVL
jgi:adenylate kinase family enzyme